MLKKRVFIYIRVSTREQAEEGYSIGEQETRLIKYCEAMEWEVVKVFIDGGYTGSNIDRPALNDMIRRIKKGDTDIVLVDKLDRLSRSQFDTLYLIQKVFNEHNVAFISRAEAFDTSTTFGRAMVGILAVFAELERERIKERMIDGKEGRAKEGKYKGGGHVPIGYDYDNDKGILIVNEYEAMQIKEAFDLFNKRTPVNAIATILNDKGYRTKYGQYKKNTFYTIFKNPVYIGKIQHKGKVYEGEHEGFIPVDVFKRAQTILKERDKEYEHHKAGRRYKSPLGGLIWCKNCGGKYHWRVNGYNRDGSKRAYYICYSRAKTDRSMIKDPNCKNKSYRDKNLEELIYNEVRKLKIDPEYIFNIRASVDTSESQKLLKERIERIERQISKLMDLYTIEDMDISVLKSKIEPLNAEKRTLTTELENLEHQQPTKPVECVTSLVDLFEQSLRENNCYEIHDVLCELIERIEIENEDIIIHWNF